MSIISQKNENEVAILDCVQRFFSSYKVGSLLKQCNDTEDQTYELLTKALFPEFFQN